MDQKRLFIERKNGFQIERDEIYRSIIENLNLNLESLRYLIIYDIFNINQSLFEISKNEVFSERNKDFVVETPELLNTTIAIEFLPGQFDQRADSAIQCIKLIDPNSSPIVKSGFCITFDENLTSDKINLLEEYLINNVESRRKDLSKLHIEEAINPDDVSILEGFVNLDSSGILNFHNTYSLAMNIEDLKFIQDYFKNKEKRNPTETELRVLDTYWSDHCRHTTFETEIKSTMFSLDKITHQIEDTFKDYLETRKKLGIDTRPITLMDLATINARYEKSQDNLADLEVSEEINAASIYIDVEVDGIIEKWLLMFKNETHNHPTEIEPFGGASTCIGGAIRDPLSGRSYVYSAMRITGAGNITESLRATIDGKLPQKHISKEAARGYSSYGNQIGLATSFVREIYHEGYKAKRMEIGAVVAAAPIDNVRRETPIPGDIIILLGGKTGRDGIGGATGSSKTHNKNSIETSSAEVQKGNAPEERKIQRLFRNPQVTKLIKKSNDFGAGGVSVAIGELADGIIIDLDKVPTKYDGINGTELAISESQERMSVVVSKEDEQEFLKLCEQENIEAVSIAKIQKAKRLVMTWKNKVICDISREFIETSGVRQSANVEVLRPSKNLPFERSYHGETLTDRVKSMLQDLNVSSQQGLVEMFDSTIGRTTVLAPYGGKYQLTQSQNSIHKIPVLKGKTNTVSMMSYGYNPYIFEWSQFHGAQYSIIESMAKNVAAGGYYKNIRFTFQEYFERLENNEQKWAKPFTALLGAYKTLKEFNLASIGGKDSMSGTYHNLNVPPTLVSFAVNTAKVSDIISNEFKSSGNYLYVINHSPDKIHIPDYDQLKNNFEFVYRHIQNQTIVSANALEFGGLAESIIKASFGNKIGANVITVLPLFKFNYGSILVESTTHLKCDNAVYIGRTTNDETLNINDCMISIDEAIKINRATIEKVYPIHHEDHRTIEQTSKSIKRSYPVPTKVETVNVLIPVFPGTNCEYDSQKVFDIAGAKTEMFVFNNLTEQSILKSIDQFVDKIKYSHIIIFSGGFSSGDEPDGSGKFITSVLKNEKIKNAIESHLTQKRLILGICNGFQALVKSGLLPYGEIKPIEEGSPTLFKNKINRHISKFVKTKVSTLNSPWLNSFEIDETHVIPVSHGEGRFIISQKDYKKLTESGQIAFQYVDDSNEPTYDPMFNPNGSDYAIEGIISKDGLILGKMGHSERFENGLFINIDGPKEQNIFLNAVNYFKGE